ncbi:MAG: sensor domain-containing diguanylate cyclase [Butyrivibrio sp.]|nr:sensor domain-containing diguanylate cyclase [Butyrivibrio sp.]
MNNQAKSIVARWAGPTLALIAALVIMFFNFSAKSEEEARDTISKTVIMMIERSAHNFKEEVIKLVKVGEPITDILGEKADFDSKDTVGLLETTVKYSGAYKVYACDINGKGVNNEGGEISIAEEEYFSIVSGSEDVRYIYNAEEDASEEGALLVTLPISNEQADNIGYLVMFYQLKQLRNVVKNIDFAAWNSTSLIDRKGNVIAVTGKGTEWKPGDNIYTELEGKNKAAVNSMKSRVNTNTSGVAYVNMYNLDNCLAYAPVGMGEMVLVAGVAQSYIDGRAAATLENFRTMIIELIIVIIVFLVLIVIISIINKTISGKKQKQLEVKADTDLLTGLNNKLATERKIKEYIAQNPNSQSMMFILDIDNFKNINDTRGHAFGDEVLRTLGEQVRVLFRSSDIIGRAGGDEFIVFLKNISDPAAIRKEAKKVENFFQNFKVGEYTKYTVTASIGVAIFPEEGADFETIYKAADTGLYKAKKGGKNQLAFYKEKWLEENPANNPGSDLEN